MKATKKAKRCILCNRRPNLTGMFFPNKPANYGAPPGKMRIIMYPICSKCRRKPGSSARVERAIKDDLFPDRN